MSKRNVQVSVIVMVIVVLISLVLGAIGARIDLPPAEAPGQKDGVAENVELQGRCLVFDREECIMRDSESNVDLDYIYTQDGGSP